MDEALVKLCSDEHLRKEFIRLYGTRPEDKSKERKYMAQMSSFFLGAEVGKKHTKKQCEEAVEEFFADIDEEETILHSNGKKYVSLRYLVELRV